MKVAIVGFGSAGKRHLNNLLNLGVKNIVIISSHLPEKDQNIGGRIIPVVKDISKVIDSIDILVISNSTNLHLEYIKLAIKNHIHAYIEKPIALSTEQLKDIAQEASDKNLVIAVGTQFRFNEMLMKIKKLLVDNYFGRIISVMSSHGEHISDYHPGEDYKLSYSANNNQGGGVLLTQIHHIDYLEWLFGPFTHAYANEICTPNLNIDVEAIINYSLISSKSRLQIHGHMNYLQRPKSTTLSITGELGSVFWSYEKNTISLKKNRENIKEESPLDRNKMFLLAMSDFLESIKFHRKPKSTISDGIKSIEIVQSIKRSSSSGLVEKISKRFI
jgi:predicted dehydrogenase